MLSGGNDIAPSVATIHGTPSAVSSGQAPTWKVDSTTISLGNGNDVGTGEIELGPDDMHVGSSYAHLSDGKVLDYMTGSISIGMTDYNKMRTLKVDGSSTNVWEGVLTSKSSDVQADAHHMYVGGSNSDFVNHTVATQSRASVVNLTNPSNQQQIVGGSETEVEGFDKVYLPDLVVGPEGIHNTGTSHVDSANGTVQL